jgi:hypothetical protein
MMNQNAYPATSGNVLAALPTRAIPSRGCGSNPTTFCNPRTTAVARTVSHKVQTNSHAMALFGNRQKLTAKDVRSILGRFLDGTAEPYEFDDFVSLSIEDPRLDAIRERCAGLSSEFPPEVRGHYCGEGGVEVMRRFMKELENEEV